MPFFTQPYYRLKEKGSSSLSDAELLAVIITSGSKGESALDKANKLLKKYNFHNLANLGFTVLKNELGEVKALRVISLFEVARRFNRLGKNGFTKTIECAADVFNILADELKGKKQEHFYVLYLDSRNKIIEKPELINLGVLNSVLTHPREIFKEAILRSANSLILVHNHPSGDCNPSEEDLKITKRMIKIGELMDVKVLDHIIIGDSYWSYMEKV